MKKSVKPIDRADYSDLAIAAFLIAHILNLLSRQEPRKDRLSAFVIAEVDFPALGGYRYLE